MGSTASSPPDPIMEEKNKNEEENIPSVYVNYEFLNFDTVQKCQKVYEIAGNTYTDNLEVHEVFKEFELYAERVHLIDETTETSSKKLNFEVEPVDNGYIINSSIFLNNHHYNTLTNIFEDCLNCFVCDVIVLEENSENHVESEHHKRCLEACPPVEEFRLNIFRLRNDHYHCGVCNDVLYKRTCNNHFTRQTHANNKIIATKKAADINRNNDMQIENNDTQDNIDDTDNKVDKTELDKRVSVKTMKNTFKISYYTWHMILIAKDNNFYCMACKLKDSIDNLQLHIKDIYHKNNLELFKINDMYEKHLIRQNEKWCHCSTCNSVHYLGGTDLHISRHDKGKTNSESVKTIVISDDKSKDNKNENNDSPSASNGQIVNNTNALNMNDATKNKSNGNINENNDSPFKSNRQIENNNALNINEVANIVTPVINERCFLYLFGFKIQVSLLSMHVIHFNDLVVFHCGLCKVTFPSHTVLDHMKSSIHVSRFNLTPPLQQYGYNYIRSIDNLPHCGVCHMLIQPQMLLFHLQDPHHIMQTNIALGLVNLLTPLPRQVANVTPNVPHNLKKDAQIKTEETCVINSNEIENRINDSKNKIDEIKNVDETKNGINEIVKTKNSNVYVEVNESKINEIELNYDGDYNTGIFDAEIEVLTKKARVQVSLTSYNTLVPIGDGDRYCFACGVTVECDTLKNHICSKAHTEMIKDIKFLEEYNYNLIRQNASLYHCAICNTVVRKSDLNNHIEWTIHEEERKQHKTSTKKKERNTVEFQNQLFPTATEVYYSNKMFKDIVIKWYFIIKPEDSSNSKSTSTEQVNKYEESNVIRPNTDITSRNNKTIMIEDLNIKLVLKWDAWHSIICTKKKYMCVICNEKMNDVYVDIHMNSESHKRKLEKPFTKKYFPALIREVNSNKHETVMLHCATCHILLFDKSNIPAHINGGKHKRHLEDLLKISMDDSNEDVMIV